MSQPRWRFVVNLGDAHPLEYGGYFVYRDMTGVYGYEAELVELLNENDERSKLRVIRVCLDRLKEVRDGDAVHLVPFTYEATWPHPVHRYEEWFTDKLASIASYVGRTVEDLRASLCSEDGVQRAEAYRNVYDHEGWANGNEYPMTLTMAEAKRRYRSALQRPRTVNDRKLDKLKKEARSAAGYRGHTLKRFVTHYSKTRAITECRECACYVQVNAAPLPNETAIGGDAVAIGCIGSKKKEEVANGKM